jgi:hypothetical protein
MGTGHGAGDVSHCSMQIQLDNAKVKKQEENRVHLHKPHLTILEISEVFAFLLV